MRVQRGDIVTVYFPFSSGTGGKVRPALVIQSDLNNRRLKNVIVAAITTTRHRRNEPTQLAIDIGTTSSGSTGLLQDSVVTCENLATLETSLIRRRLGAISASMMQAVDSCLKAALGIA